MTPANIYCGIVLGTDDQVAALQLSLMGRFMSQAREVDPSGMDSHLEEGYTLESSLQDKKHPEPHLDSHGIEREVPLILSVRKMTSLGEALKG